MRGDKASQSRWNASVAEEPGREHTVWFKPWIVF